MSLTAAQATVDQMWMVVSKIPEQLGSVEAIHNMTELLLCDTDAFAARIAANPQTAEYVQALAAVALMETTQRMVQRHADDVEPTP